MNRNLIIMPLSFVACLFLMSGAAARSGANVSITSGPVFIDDINGLNFKVGHNSTYTFTIQMESDVAITAATLGFKLYSPDGSLNNVIWNAIPKNIGLWGENSTWNFSGSQLSTTPISFNGTLPSIWMTGGVAIPGSGFGYGPVGLTDALEFTITLPGIDGGILCLDSAFYPTAGTWLASPLQNFEWAGGVGDLAVGGSRDHAFCVTTFVTADISTCPSFAQLDHCDTLNYSTFFDPAPEGQSLTYTATTTGKGTVSIDTAGNVSYVPSADEFTAILITVTATSQDSLSSSCRTAVTFANNPPSITCPPNILLIEGTTNTTPPASVVDPDVCDTHLYSLVRNSPHPAGRVSIDSLTGAVTFTSDTAMLPNNQETDYTVCIEVYDGMDTDQCCLTFTVLPYVPPCPDTVTVSHCGPLYYHAFEYVLYPDSEEIPFQYSISTTGAGEVTVDSIGFVTYTPSLGESGEILITVIATEPDGSTSTCLTNVTIINHAPLITCPQDVSVLKGSSKTSPPSRGADVDACDAIIYSLISVTPSPAGVISVDPSTGAVTFASDSADVIDGSDTDYTICIEATDGIDTDLCCMTFTVLNTQAACITIGQTDKTDPLGGSLQGHNVEICITYEGGSEQIGGFDFMIQYESQALSFVGATEGNIYSKYAWEYFTYRIVTDSNCTNECPTGKLRIVGIANEIDDLNPPPNTTLEPGDQFACLTFRVSNDRNLGCQFVPIRWSWNSCRDNMLASSDGDALYISRDVFDYIGTDMSNPLSYFRADITDMDHNLPTVRGAPATCDTSALSGTATRFVDFKNGGVRVTCFDNSDDTGDLNLNGLSNELADIVLFCDYLVNGPDVFTIHQESQISTSEVNGDGFPGTVADLVYMIRTFFGNAVPQSTLEHLSDTVTITHQDGIVTSDRILGGALFVFEGDITPTLLATNMNMLVGHLDGTTRVLIKDIELGTEYILQGPVLQAEGKLILVDASDTLGARMVIRHDFVTDVEDENAGTLPRSFALHQNYPNPFNPSTTISIDFPSASKYSLTIYNVRGQKVKTFTGTQNAGTLDIIWEPNKLPSGVYFYKLRARDFVATKKLVLLK